MSIGSGGMTFEDRTIEIELGQTVCWIWTNETMAHNVAQTADNSDTTRMEGGVYSGSDFVLPGRHVQLEAIRKMIASEQPTFTAMVPTVLGDLLHAPEEKLLDMSSFRMLVCGGSAVAPSLIDEAKKVWHR